MENALCVINYNGLSRLGTGTERSADLAGYRNLTDLTVEELMLTAFIIL